MSNENVYSNKDSNRNRWLEEKENKQKSVFVAFLVILVASVLAIYFYQKPHPASITSPQINAIAPLSKKAAPVEAYTKPKDEAKPYDSSTPPYAQ